MLCRYSELTYNKQHVNTLPVTKWHCIDNCRCRTKLNIQKQTYIMANIQYITVLRIPANSIWLSCMYMQIIKMKLLHLVKR